VNVSPERLQCFRFGVFEADVRAHELRKDGARVRLQIQPFQVLALLLERAGDVVTRDELRQKLWPSSVYIDFDHGLNNAIARLREALGDEAATPRYIETLPRVGYRFIHPLDAPPANGSADLEEIARDAATSAPAEAPRVNRPRRIAIVAATSLAVVGTILLAGWLIERRTPHTGETRDSEASIAVLPLVSLSSDKENEYFADGLTEELTQKLAGIRGLKVAGRTSSYAFKGRNESAEVIGKALGVNHLLEGSVRYAGTRVRITAQLVATRDGFHLWSQTFDRNITDIFQIQEDIAQAVATALQIRLAGDEAARLRRRGTQDAEAYRLFVIAKAYQQGIAVTRDLEYSRRLFEQALARDPRFGAAHAGIARYHFKRSFGFIDVDRGGQLGIAAAERAVALDPESSDALEAEANFQYWQYRLRDDFSAYVRAHRGFRRAIELDPTNVLALFDYGRAILWYEPELAQSLFARALEVDPLARGAQNLTATIHSMQGDPEAARAQCRAWVNRHVGDNQLCNIVLAVVERDFGHLDESIVQLRQLRQNEDVSLRLLLWSLYLSLNDPAAARGALDLGETDLARALTTAASLTMERRYREAFAALERQRAQFAFSRILDVPAARLALIADEPARARDILKLRLPDLVSGTEQVNARNVMPALDLVAAWSATGDTASANAMLARVRGFFAGPSVPRLPYFDFVRARMHCLGKEPQVALQALEQAYQRGFRTTWSVDVQPQPYLYIDPIDVDPAFAALRGDPAFARWLARLNADNARQLERLRAHDAA